MPSQRDKLIATARFLTLFPLPGTKKNIAPQLVMMPLVGLILGLILFGTAHLLATSQPLFAALLITIVWFVSTGFLHLDGLADLVDGLAASHGDTTRLLAVMKEPQIGTFAVAALILVILSKFICLTTLATASSWFAIILIPAWSRLGAAWWAQRLPPLTDGLATWCKKAGQTSLLPWFIILLILSLILAPALLFAPVTLWLWKWFLATRLGGMNGDCLGAGIEICEVGLLFLCCVAL